MKKNILLLLICLSINTLLAQSKEENLILETKIGKIKGTLLFPKLRNKVPLVLIIAGSGPTDRNGNNPMMINNSLKILAEGLCKNDIASLRFDKRGIGESRNAMTIESNLRFEDYVDDVKKWIEFLQKDERFESVIVLGHSEGSLIGMIAIQKTKVKKFISIAGIAEKASKILREQIKMQSSNLLEQANPIIEKLEKGDTVSNISPIFFNLFRPSVQPYLISWFKYNPQEEIAKLNCPILIIQGTNDIQVTTDNATKLSVANKKAIKIIIPQMNHIMKESELDRQKNIQTYFNPNLPIKSELIQELVKFINQ